MAKRESVMLAHVYEDQYVHGWFVSEKYNGHRAWWDGGISRGMLSCDVPWANIDKDKEPVFVTGLWSRRGKPIQAPGWFLDALPHVILDGELWVKRGIGALQTVSSIVRKKVPNDEEWKQIKYIAFDSPPLSEILRLDGLPWRVRGDKWEGVKLDRLLGAPIGVNYWGVYQFLQQHCSGVVTPVDCFQLKETGEIEKKLGEVLELGGEGLMLRDPSVTWTPTRSWGLLKVKPKIVEEATVTGYQWAREGKLEGLMGCLLVTQGRGEFGLSGFTDDERKLCSGETWEPGKRVCNGYSTLFPVGSKIKFTYREKSSDGIPQEARFCRA